MRHLKTVRTHLLWLVRHNKISSEENGVDYTQGLTEQVWRSLYYKGQVSLKVMTVKKYTFTCIVKNFFVPNLLTVITVVVAQAS